MYSRYMEDSEPSIDFRTLFLSEKISDFIRSTWNFTEKFGVYKGYLTIADSEMISFYDFLDYMKSFGFVRDEIEQNFIDNHVTKKEGEE